jgi:hypothetical protein
VSYLIYVNWLEREFNPSLPLAQTFDSPLVGSSTQSRRSATYGLLDEDDEDSAHNGLSTSQQSSTVLITCDGKTPSAHSEPMARQVSGVFVCPDPTQGHVALIRFCDGYLSAVNITIQRKLLQLEGRIKVSLPSSPSIPPSSLCLSLSESNSSRV